MAFSKEFKDALSELPLKEKDKLILRLLRRDKILASRLEFELLGLETAEERRSEMETKIREQIRRISDRSWNAGYLILQIRSVSGEITTHVKITKDKIGEVSLNLLMLNEVLRQNTTKIEHTRSVKAEKIAGYIIARAFKVLVMIRDLHEDYLLEFKEDLEQLGEYLSKSSFLMRIAIRNGLDVNWLLSGEFPEDMKARQMGLRKMGFLK